MDDAHLDQHIQGGQDELRIFGIQEGLLILVEIRVILCVPGQTELWRQIADDEPRLAEPLSVGEFQSGRPEDWRNSDYLWLGDPRHQGRIVLDFFVGGSGIFENESDTFASPWNAIPLGFKRDSRDNRSTGRSSPVVRSSDKFAIGRRTKLTYVVKDIRSDLLPLSWTIVRILFLSGRHDDCLQETLVGRTDCRLSRFAQASEHVMRSWRAGNRSRQRVAKCYCPFHDGMRLEFRALAQGGKVKEG